MESEQMLTPREKSPLPEAQRRIEPAALHHSGQRNQHTADWTTSAPCYGSILTQLSKQYASNRSRQATGNWVHNCKNSPSNHLYNAPCEWHSLSHTAYSQGTSQRCFLNTIPSYGHRASFSPLTWAHRRAALPADVRILVFLYIYFFILRPLLKEL